MSLPRILPIAIALVFTSNIEARPDTSGSDEVTEQAMTLTEKARSTNRQTTEAAWEKYETVLLQEKESAIRKGELELVNKIEKETQSPTAHPEDWPTSILREACRSYHDACERARRTYLAEIDKLIPIQVRLRNLQVANTLSALRESLNTRDAPAGRTYAKRAVAVVDNFDDGGFEMKSFANGHEVGVRRTEAPHEPSRKKTQGLQLDWPSPHADQIEAYYVGKRPPLIDSPKPTALALRLWLERGGGPSKVQVRFSDRNSEVFVWSNTIQEPDQVGWRRVSIPIDWNNYDYSFGGSSKDGIVDFPVSVQGYAFLFEGKQLPASWLLVDDVTILRGN